MGDVTSPDLHCSILGPLEVRVAGRGAVIGAPKQRLLLAILLCHANAVIASDQLIDSLWGETPPRTARKNLQVYVSALRKIVGDRISFQGWGYRMRATSEELDLLRFLELGKSGRAAARSGDLVSAAALLGDAVRLWRTRPLEEFCHVPLVAAEVGRFTELFLSIYEDWVELEIELGRHVEALTSLDIVAARFPTRERITAARMTALARCGRTAEALATFDNLRRHLAAEMGIDPSPMIGKLYQSILRGEGPPPVRLPGLAVAAQPRPVRALANRLPRDIHDFVGREAEIRRILDEPAPVTLITGGLGTGKTTLAVHVAHMLAPDYPDGAVVISLRRGGVTRSAAEIQREILEDVGLDVGGVREDDVLAAIWRSWLADRKVLLVLDDAPDESSVRTLLPGTASSRVLVTSQSRLSGLESVARIGLEDLCPSEGIEFLSRLVGRDRVHGDLPAVLRIFRRCGLSPLVLRVLGGRLARLPHLPLGMLADRLERTENVLDEFVAGDVSLRRRFEDSYARPAWPHRAAFAALGALDGPVFGHEELVAALDGVEGPGERVIELLLEANVLSITPIETDADVVAHSMAYSMSPLAHRFAVELRGDGCRR